MKQNHNLPHTILDAEYQIIDGEEKLEEGVQKGGVITALVLGVLGLTALFFPVAVGTGFAFFITVGVFLSGISQVMLFVREDKEKRSGWMLANGILLVAAAGLTLLGALMGELGILQMIASVSFLMGVLTMSVGLSQITSALGENRKAPGRGIEDVLFKNITYNGQNAELSHIIGYNHERMVRNIRFENLRINGTVISDDMPGKPAWYKTGDMARIFIGEHVDGVTFSK